MRQWLKRCKERLVFEDEQGQAIVIIAFVIIALLLFAGLALDAATIYAGQTKLKRAVDAAVLAGVVELPDETAAENRTRQFMRANGFDTVDNPLLPLFQVARIPATGYLQWVVTATYNVPLNFLPIVNFDYAPVTEVAVGEYRSVMDIYTTQTGGRGIVGKVNMSNWGKYANPTWGDAFTPECWTCASGCPLTLNINPITGDVLSCPAGSQTADTPDGFNPDRVELYNEYGSGYPFRIHIPDDYAFDEVQIELQDPDGYNVALGPTVVITHLDGITETKAVNCPNRKDACYVLTGDTLNPYWMLRIDENRSFSGDPPGGYAPAFNTQTEYRLFYHKQLADNSIVRQDIGTYVGWATEAADLADDGQSSDMKWIVAWVVDVNCDDGGCDVPDIFVNEDGSRSLRLEVDGVSGYSENGFDLWAGPPPPVTETIPSEVNARNIYLLDPAHEHSHETGDIVTYGAGYLPLNLNRSGAITITLSHVPIAAAGMGVNIFHFDNDQASQPIDYYLEGVPDWHYVGALSGGGTWGTTNYQYQPPGLRHHDHVVLPQEFYGGYLWAVYNAGWQDSSSWRLEYEGVVGDMFVRLIE